MIKGTHMTQQQREARDNKLTRSYLLGRATDQHSAGLLGNLSLKHDIPNVNIISNILINTIVHRPCNLRVLRRLGGGFERFHRGLARHGGLHAGQH